MATLGDALNWRTNQLKEIFINFENFTDTRLSNYQSTVIPPLTNPSFPEIWAPTDGFIFTAGVKWTILGELDED